MGSHMKDLREVKTKKKKKKKRHTYLIVMIVLANYFQMSLH